MHKRKTGRGISARAWFYSQPGFHARGAAVKTATCDRITSCKCPHGGPLGNHDVALETVCGAVLVDGACPKCVAARCLDCGKSIPSVQRLCWDCAKYRSDGILIGR